MFRLVEYVYDTTNTHNIPLLNGMKKQPATGQAVPWTTVIVPTMLLIVIAHLALLFSSRAHPTANSHDEPYRVVLMSDTHVIGPQYVPGTESNPVDNESILKTPRRLKEVPAACTSSHGHHCTGC